jgi:hypothetical protein
MTNLDDASAIYILKTLAQARLQPATLDIASSPELRAALADTFSNSPQPPASEGDLARAALQLLAEDPAFAEPIQIMSIRAAAPASRDRYVDAGSIALTTAALLALQTRIKFKRAFDGKWSIEVEKKAAGDGAVKLLVERLLSVLR